MKVFAGCDGGGTTCVVRVVGCTQAGDVVAEGQGLAGPANVQTNAELALQSILEATRRAFLEANLATESIGERFIAGLAGARDTAVQESWQQLLREQLRFHDVQVLSDVELLFAERNRPNEGVVATVIGTGSVAYFRDHHGYISRAGGGGPHSGDGGSAFWMGRRVIQAANESASLHKLVSQCFATDDLTSLQRRLKNGNLPTAAVASLAPALFQLDDQAALDITEDAAKLIADMLVNALPQQSAEPYPWICSGGVAIHQPEWLATIRSRCADRKRLLSPPQLVAEPVGAAVRLARQ